MKIEYHAKVVDPKKLEEIRKLLVLCDKEFVPALSSRSTTVQSQLKESDKNEGIEAYFQGVASQSAILAIEDNKVVAFMSFRKDYICEHIKIVPNLYITTVIVHPDYRQNGIAGKMYDRIIRQFPKCDLFTRTWSTNISHIRILLSLGFHEHCQLSDDRGEGIDTNYYRLKPKKNSVLQYIEQYHLGNNIFFCLLLLFFAATFIMVWLFTDGGVYHELSLAISTSLMASLLCLVSDTFLKIRESKNDTYINKLKSYGVENLQFNKNELLEGIIPTCRNELWISGCRLIMTSKASFRQAMITACKRSKNLHIKILATPQWSVAYQLTYGQEDVSLNYLKILKDLLECCKHDGLSLEVHFSEKPLFSDTYKVDDRFITGPYLHCADRYNGRITAKDFFSLDISDPNTELYRVIQSDYMTLWNESVHMLDLQMLAKELETVANPADLSAEKRVEILRKCCVPLSD